MKLRRIPYIDTRNLRGLISEILEGIVTGCRRIDGTNHPYDYHEKRKNEFDQVDSGVRSLTSYAVGCWQQLFTEEPDSWRGTPLTH